MGIERFFGSIEKSSMTNVSQILTKAITATHLYIDFNSIVHVNSKKILDELNFILFAIISDKKQTPKFKQYMDRYNIPSNILSSPTKFAEYYRDNKNEKLNELIVEKVREYVFKILTKYVEPDKLKFVMIAVDGVPSKSKMIEQKKRRYMGTILSKLKKKIFRKHENEIKKHDERYLFEQLKISWSKNNISPGTDFMLEINRTFVAFDMETDLQKSCPNLKEFVFSGSNERGEGEKKIIDHIRSKEHHKIDENNRYVIYSPDSDVTLLGMLLNTPLAPVENKNNNYLNIGAINNIIVMRHNQQTNQYNIIDVDHVNKNLYTSLSKLVTHKNKKLEKNRVIDDLVFIFVMFGNDFVPKIESINVKTDFDKIIKQYAALLNENDLIYMIKYDSKRRKKVINARMFLDFLRILKQEEGASLQNNYMSSSYKNYYRIKQVMEISGDNLTDVLNNFLADLRNFHDAIRSGDNKIIDKWIDKDKFIHKLKKLVRFSKGEDLRKVNNKQFVEKYKDHYRRYGKMPRVEVTFMRYPRSIEDRYHKGNAEATLDYLGPNVKVLEYDLENYKLERMLDEYIDKLNAHDLELGRVWIDPKTYIWKADRIEDGVKKYYRDFFGIKDIVMGQGNKELQKLVKEYLNGIVWVLDTYYNEFDISKNHNRISIWRYKYTRAPLITQIYQYLKYKLYVDSDYLDNTSDYLDEKLLVDSKDFFNPVEHLMWASPAPEILDMIPDEYVSFVKKHKSIYPDVNAIADKIWSQKLNEEVDCRGMIFVNKCVFRAVEEEYPIKDNEFIEKVRKIPIVNEDTGEKKSVESKALNVTVMRFGTQKQVTSIGGIRDTYFIKHKIK
jgi:5'-3' exonuclease